MAEQTRSTTQQRGGEPTAVRESIPSLPAKPRVSDAELAERERVAADLKSRRLMGEAWRSADVPKRHQKQVTADPHSLFPWSKKLTMLRVRLGSGFLIALLGTRGTGKTQLAAELIRYRIWTAEDKRCLYTRAADIFIAIREAYRRDGPGEQDQILRFVEPQLLVIDEVNIRGNSAWEDSLLGSLIDKRYGDTSDTLLISNQLEEDFRHTIGESIYSRLAETGGIVVCDWGSFRRSKAND